MDVFELDVATMATLATESVLKLEGFYANTGGPAVLAFLRHAADDPTHPDCHVAQTLLARILLHGVFNQPPGRSGCLLRHNLH